MEAITILRRCRNADAEIQRLVERIRQRRDALSAITPQFDPNGGSRSHGNADKIGRLVADIDELERSLEARREAKTVEIAAACLLLDGLPKLESSVLYGYYIGHETASAIANRMKYQDGYIRKVKTTGERALREISAERVADALPAWYLRRNDGIAT